LDGVVADADAVPDQALEPLEELLLVFRHSTIRNEDVPDQVELRPLKVLLRPEEGLPFQLEQFEVNLAGKFENCLREVHEEATECDVEEVQGRRVELQVGSDAANRVQEGDADICHLVCRKREVEVEKVLLED
jgi:hypothetical protein